VEVHRVPPNQAALAQLVELHALYLEGGEALAHDHVATVEAVGAVADNREVRGRAAEDWRIPLRGDHNIAREQSDDGARFHLRLLELGSRWNIRQVRDLRVGSGTGGAVGALRIGIIVGNAYVRKLHGSLDGDRRGAVRVHRDIRDLKLFTVSWKKVRCRDNDVVTCAPGRHGAVHEKRGLFSGQRGGQAHPACA